jgi:RND family efflux transporter, MFP subunit
LIRQILASLVVLAGAALAWVFFAPGSTETLARVGISLPFAPDATNQQPGRPGGGGGPGVPGMGPGGGRPGGFGGRQTNVVTAAVTTATINDRLTAVGEGSAVRSVTVTTPAGGELAEVLVRPGQEVAAGDIIARFDSAAEQIAYDRARLAVEDAQSALARTQGLASSSLVATTALTAAELAANNAELELRNAEVALGRRTITSPIAGTVGLLRVTPGNYVGAQTTVTTIDDTSSVLIDFWVPERYAANITRGMPVTVSAVALPGRSFAGEVSAIDNRIDPASRTLQVQAEIPNPDGILRSGMSFSVALDFPGEQFPAVNPLAILWSTEGSYVWKYEDGRAKRVMAEIVQRNSDGVLVRADLSAGDAIITEGILQLSEGAKVTLLDGPDGSTATAAASTKP